MKHNRHFEQIPDPTETLKQLLINNFKIPAEVAGVVSQVANGNFENANNLRWAQAGNQQQIADYKEKRNKGCCIFIDRIIFDDSGNPWLYGWNYGHQLPHPRLRLLPRLRH